MYERIVILEQKQLEHSAKVDQLNQQMTKMALQMANVHTVSDGVLVWKIAQFSSKVDAMSANPNLMVYSNEAYTSPHGYRFCARVNISQKCRGFIGLHIHLMRSDNDYHLDWPFKGRIKIQMIHPRNIADSQNDTIMSKPEILAFHRPHQDVSPRGFGFMEYACIGDIISNGFLDQDVLTIKVQINIV